ncbi:hypothetical protein Har1131_17330 [Haloarcula sp. CBA1131]|nr:hypothetical protein Har1131_19070 [Haloarcula sp. CBA1131]KAA9404131.1 hypothetical protein Har1131_17330 [Haloarcula sp. CBA1131]
MITPFVYNHIRVYLIFLVIFLRFGEGFRISVVLSIILTINYHLLITYLVIKLLLEIRGKFVNNAALMDIIL